ncbi:hypothetical protein AAFF_G00160820 [Aldrovandia affinis]|uniref:IMD domain-containing protein n=1 Tax=Aldrovandia affinis TaxID=143900 RepID=A0AAD7RNC8_9TELE|nr:hypothetical protein AAFF_G00160820 [Aldrovandia affinis]
MSRDTEEVSKLTESTYKNVMEQFNPGLRNLVTLGKNYEKAASAMTLAGKVYFDAVSKIGENAAGSPGLQGAGLRCKDLEQIVTVSELHPGSVCPPRCLAASFHNPAGCLETRRRRAG